LAKATNSCGCVRIDWSLEAHGAQRNRIQRDAEYRGLGVMVKEGYYFGLPLLVLAGAAYLLQWPALAVVLVCLALFVFSFFRDPNRTIPQEVGAVVSPADGRVVVVTDEENAGRPGKRISIFLAVWNVHLNRAPAEGVIADLQYKPGRFLAAMKAEASLQNEQNIFALKTDAGEMVFKQIAGLIARRVVSWKNPGDRVARGERIGLVRFGSRADVWLPAEAEILVKVGENVKGGSSVLAKWLPKRVAGSESSAAVTAGSKLVEAGKAN
jgi:phosphatidylserine decarboxylase